MTVRELIEKLGALPPDLEIWSQDNGFVFPRTLEIRQTPIYENHYEEEPPCWEMHNAGMETRKAKRVLLIQ